MDPQRHALEEAEGIGIEVLIEYVDVGNDRHAVQGIFLVVVDIVAVGRDVGQRFGSYRCAVSADVQRFESSLQYRDVDFYRLNGFAFAVFFDVDKGDRRVIVSRGKFAAVYRHCGKYLAVIPHYVQHYRVRVSGEVCQNVTGQQFAGGAESHIRIDDQSRDAAIGGIDPDDAVVVQFEVGSQPYLFDVRGADCNRYGKGLRQRSARAERYRHVIYAAREVIADNGGVVCDGYSEFGNRLFNAVIEQYRDVFGNRLCFDVEFVVTSVVSAVESGSSVQHVHGITVGKYALYLPACGAYVECDFEFP